MGMNVTLPKASMKTKGSLEVDAQGANVSRFDIGFDVVGIGSEFDDLLDSDAGVIGEMLP